MKVLIVAPNWLGDLVIAQSLIKALKFSRPHIVIDVCAPKSIVSIANRMDDVHAVIPLDFKPGEFGLYKRMVLSQKIKRHYDWAITLPITFKSALLPFFAGIKRRTGFLGEFRHGLLNDIVNFEHKLGKIKGVTQQEIYLALLGVKLKDLNPNQQKLIAPKLSVDSQNQQALIEKFNIKTKKPIVALAMGSNYGIAKQWPVENFANLAANLIERKFQILLLGSPNEQKLAEAFFAQSEIKKITENPKTKAALLDCIGKTSLEDSVDLLALCNTLVTNDSGLMHVGAALGIQIVAIYGSSSPKLTPAITQNPNQLKVFESDLACAPCLARTCRFGHYDCLKQTRVSDVLQALHT